MKNYGIVLALLACMALSAHANDKKQAIEKANDLVQRIYSAMPQNDSATFMQMCDTLYYYGTWLDDEGNSFKRISIGSRVGFFVNHDGFALAKTQLDALRYLSEQEEQYHELYITWYNLVLGYGNSHNPTAAIIEKQNMQNHALQHKNYEGVALSYMATAALYEYSTDLGLQNLKKALEYAKDSNQPTLRLNIYTSLCIANRSLKRWSELMHYAKSLKSMPHKNAYYTELAEMMMLSAYVGQGNKAEATRLYEKYSEHYNRGDLAGFNVEQWQEVAVEYLLAYGPASDIPPYLSQMEGRNVYVPIALEYYRKIGDYEHALQYADSLNAQQVKSFAENEKAQMASANAAFDNQALMFDKEEISQKSQKTLLFVACVFLVLLAAAILYMVCIMRKLKEKQSDLMQANEEIKAQKAKVDEGEQVKSMFIRNLSHEVCSPLQRIAGFAKVLAEEELSEEDRLSFRDEVAMGVSEVTVLVNNINELSQIISDNTAPPMQTVNIKELCRDTLRHCMRHNTKPLTFKIDTDANYMVPSNEMYLSHILSNLLDNAIKFTSKGHIGLKIRIEQQMLAISITDTGIGIPADKQEWVFEQFTKIDPSTPGMGMGLYLCRCAVSRLGGSIHADSTYTDGCRMVVSLPLTRAN